MKAIVKSPLHHDGRIYAIGSEVDLTDEQATSLANLGVVEIMPTVLQLLSTIVEIENEAVSSTEATEIAIAQAEETTEIAKTTSKKRGASFE